MNYTKILKRSWDILWSYKALWIFGIILAFTSASGYNGGGSGGRSSFNANNNNGNFNFNLPSDIRSDLENFFQSLNRMFFAENRSTLIGIIIAVSVIILLLVVISRIANYVSQTALIKMVNTYETSGEKVNWRQGLRLGWSRQAWQLFLINLVIYLPLMLITLVFVACAVLPVGLSMISKNEPTAPGIIATIGLFFLVFFILAVIGFILSLFMEVIYRECVLKGSGVIASIRQGWKKVIHNIKEVFFMWLSLSGIGLGFFLVGIPVVILLIGIALVAGGGVGVLTYFIAHAVSTTAGWIVAAVVGGTLFVAIFSIPKLFIDGLYKTYTSSVWTLFYREIDGISLDQSVLPAPIEDAPTKDDQNVSNEELPSPI
jgi:hypothetical protein